MIYRFARVSLDIGRGVLRGPDGDMQIEPRAYALLCALVENHDRVVTRDELIEIVWHGLFVSDAAVATAVKTVRQALGDTGTEQALIKTLRGRGFRFAGQVALTTDAQATGVPAAAPVMGKPRVAVLPFTVLGDAALLGPIGEAIPVEVIAQMSRQRWVQVIARGSSFRFRGDGVSLDSVGALLAVGYCVNGLIDVQDGQVEIRVELAETRSGTLMWSETFRAAGAGLRGLRQQIVTTLIVALDRYIPRHEAELAGLKGAGPLDAWSAYHLGLRHMHRITRRDNDIAKGWFARATALDPEFSSAYAAWSFCRFQDALTAYEPDHAHVLDDVRALAERSLTLDPDDPAAHFAMGRSHWMTSDPAQGLPWLDKAVTLDPNYAKAYYSRGMIRLLCGQSQASQADLAAAMALSPLDPLAFAMQGGMALSLAQEGDLDAAFHWATQAAQEPRAHHIGIMPAVAIAQLMGDAPAASRYLGLLLRRNPGATVAGFWEAMPHRDADFRATISTALIAAGLPEK